MHLHGTDYIGMLEHMVATEWESIQNETLFQFKIGRDNSRKTCPWLSIGLSKKENTYYQRLDAK
jgi:hypothetical protein